MWTSLTSALTAILLLSDSATTAAWHLHQKRTVTIDACPSSTLEGNLAATPAADTPAASAPGGLLQENSNGEVYLPVAPVSTVSVIPKPAGTASGVFYPGIPTGVPSGIFYPGPASGSGSGSGAARPTGYSNSTRNGTHHNPQNSTRVTSKPTSLSFNTTQPIPLPTGSLSRSSSQTTTFVTSSSAPSKPSSTFIGSAKPSSTIPIPSSSTTTGIPSSTSGVPFLRGVNLGGWLVLEKWMNSDLFSGSFASATDEWTFSSINGAQAAIQNHWDTFFTESDIASIAATGINALRIPIGFWAYDNADTPYLQGQDAYLEKAIGWARDHKMYVWVDCHGSPGSQNGFDNSGHAGAVDWQQQSNLDRSISVLKTMAAKYGAAEYADVVVGLELTNEPISYGNNQFSVTQKWAQQAYAAVKAQVTNEKLVVVMHDAFQGAGQWTDVAKGLLGIGSRTFGVDSHLYQLYTDADNALTQSQHITEACGWSAQLQLGNTIMPTYVGEWSAATNICVNPDGSTTAGTSCSTSGCQCQSANFEDWNDKMVEQVRRFVEAQMDVFESSSSGYFMWSAKGPGGWGFLNGIEKGVVPNPVTDRKYPGQCGGSKRREVRGSLGAGGEKF